MCQGFAIAKTVHSNQIVHSALRAAYKLLPPRHCIYIRGAFDTQYCSAGARAGARSLFGQLLALVVFAEEVLLSR